MGSGQLAQIRVGCSGWQYQSWRERFYPAGLSAAHWLPYYARHFDTVEVNNTFYGTPTGETVAQWRDSVPAGFLFAVKANRFITHRKKLHEVDRAVGRFLALVEALGDKLGPILFQLPPRWTANAQRLEQFLRTLPSPYLYAFEFRHPSWFERDIVRLLDRYGAAFCVHDFPGLRVPRLSVGRAVYVRFHGPTPGYAGRYSRVRLRRWARWLRAQARRGKPCYAYFNNDVEAAAVVDARSLRALVAQGPAVAQHAPER